MLLGKEYLAIAAISLVMLQCGAIMHNIQIIRLVEPICTTLMRSKLLIHYCLVIHTSSRELYYF